MVRAIKVIRETAAVTKIQTINAKEKQEQEAARLK